MKRTCVRVFLERGRLRRLPPIVFNIESCYIEYFREFVKSRFEDAVAFSPRVTLTSVG